MSQWRVSNKCCCASFGSKCVSVCLLMILVWIVVLICIVCFIEMIFRFCWRRAWTCAETLLKCFLGCLGVCWGCLGVFGGVSGVLWTCVWGVVVNLCCNEIPTFACWIVPPICLFHLLNIMCLSVPDVVFKKTLSGFDHYGGIGNTSVNIDWG